MDTLAPLALDRGALLGRYRANRQRSRALFDSIDPSAYYEAPIALRHPFVFYEGHLPAFSLLVLGERALGMPPVDPALEQLFERGIDPSDARAAALHARSDWPTRAAVQAFGAACDAAVEEALMHAVLVREDHPLLVGAEALFTILEHEEMHHETLAYIIARLPANAKHGPVPQADATPAPARAIIAVPAGRARLGRNRHSGFGWDNEFEALEIDVPAFAIERDNVTNGDYLRFVETGAAPPPFWRVGPNGWNLITVYGEIPLPPSWPVYVSHDAACAYATFADGRLPTEAEYDRAAYGRPDADETTYPWGNAALDAAHANADFERFDPQPVGQTGGESAWGVRDLVGNGWEWTATPFGPLPGFRPMASYPQYSADFFDGRHFVMKGASPVTSRHLVRRSFRNWFFADYPHMFATFRLVRT